MLPTVPLGMPVSRGLAIIAAVLFVVISFFVIRNQVQVHRNREARAAQATEAARDRQTLLDLLQPVALDNCQLERFGEQNDGGYLMCANLLRNVQAGYSYGISGY